MARVLVEYTDFNAATDTLAAKHAKDSGELEDVLTGMPLHLKASDQAGIQGTPIFDPVGTNAYLKAALEERGWSRNVSMPSEFSFLGTDVDYVRNGLLVEVQFSNYPFLLNNVMRSELLFKAGTPLAGNPIACVAIITKAHMFPASNSTLYYEQGVNQLSALAENNVFDVPIRLIGLFEPRGELVAVKLNKYENARYSRSLVRQEDKQCEISDGRSSRSRCRLSIVD
jgi:hypothetical protein